MVLHWTMSVVGGFLGTYAILTHNGTFGSAETGNMMELAVEVTSLELDTVAVRLLAFLVFGAAIVISYLLTTYSKWNMRKLAIWIDAIGLLTTVFLPDSLDPIAGLYPILFVQRFSGGRTAVQKDITAPVYLLRIIINSFFWPGPGILLRRTGNFWPKLFCTP